MSVWQGRREIRPLTTVTPVCWLYVKEERGVTLGGPIGGREKGPLMTSALAGDESCLHEGAFQWADRRHEHACAASPPPSCLFLNPCLTQIKGAKTFRFIIVIVTYSLLNNKYWPLNRNISLLTVQCFSGPRRQTPQIPSNHIKPLVPCDKPVTVHRPKCPSVEKPQFPCVSMRIVP